MLNLNIIGIDEVGYGCIAGPLYICALKFLKAPDFELFDSKAISEKKRNILYEKILDIAEFQLGIASVDEIINNGLASAYKIALNRAIENMFGEFYIDGNCKRGLECVCVVKGDSLVEQIKAASIVAKVSRDKYMIEQDLKFSEYLFKKHKGYGTKEHISLINKYGACRLHRTNYKLFC